jgi:general stress protein YciG
VLLVVRHCQSGALHLRSAWPVLSLTPEETNMAIEDRGFASMDSTRQREIASKGGKAAHQKGTAHEWTSEEAREAGRRGGKASRARRREAESPNRTESQ